MAIFSCKNELFCYSGSCRNVWNTYIPLLSKARLNDKQFGLLCMFYLRKNNLIFKKQYKEFRMNFERDEVLNMEPMQPHR